MLNNHKKQSTSRFLSTVAITALVAAVPGFGLAQETQDICETQYTVVPEECVQGNSDTVVRVPAEPNTEWDEGRVQNNQGFVLAIDGKPVNSDPRVEDKIRETDLALAAADVRIQYDGLESKPRLDLKLNNASGLGNGGIARFESHMNYPAFVQRGEIRIIDRGAPNGPQLLATAPIDPNGTASVAIPEGRDVVAVHRVYDARGRFDETAPLPLMHRDDRGLVAGVEEGTSTLVRQRIPVFGGAVTVSSNNVPQGSSVQTLGERVPADASGSFVIQRILPPGEHFVDVEIVGSNREFTREIEIPRKDFFIVGLADLTFGTRDTDNASLPDNYSRGRLAFYLKSKHANGVTVTASADTEEDELDNLLSNLAEKDPRSVLSRVDPLSNYPVYGDNSTSVDDTPTSGRVFVRIEKDGNYVMWGDDKARLSGNALVRNERQIYGASAHWASPEQTSRGEARAEISLYAAEPDSLPGRDVFQGTGGSAYFLQRQDIQSGSETVTVELRDRATGRVLERKVLQNGIDYSVNYIQGVIVLKEPLNSSQSAGLIVSNPGGDVQANLVVQYEYTPTLTDIDGYALGVRSQTWVTDKLRVGGTATKDTTGTGDLETVAADVVYQIGEQSFARVDYARSEGLAHSQSFSTDGGLIVNNTTPVNAAGDVIRGEVRLAFSDLGMENKGAFGFYAERREQGFSSLDYTVTAATGDEELWGVFLETKPNDDLRVTISHDNYENDVGHYNHETNLEVGYRFNERVELSFGAEYLERNDGTVTGNRTDVALRVDFTESDRFRWYVFGQATVDNTGLNDNDRYGIGGSYKLTDAWNVDGEISDGSYGIGGRVKFTHQKEDNGSVYFGYELDPSRQVANATTYGDDKGRYFIGGARKLNDRWSVFAENSYDLFSEHQSLTSAYGVTYSPSSFLSYNGAVELGRISDTTDGDFDRTAVSLGMRYQNEGLSFQGRVEYRQERGTTGGTNRDADTFLLSSNLKYEISDSARLLMSLNAAKTDTDQSSILDGKLVDFQLGYAFRPIDNDRLNVLARYRYLNDDYGQRIDGTDTTGPRQRSHVLSLDATYDLNQHWTIGGKVGARLTESAAAGATAFTENDAWLGVVNARYHLVHNWDVLVEARALHLDQAGITETGLVGAVYRHVGNNLKLGIGYNAGTFSDDLTDLVFDDRGAFVNLIAKF